MTAILQVFASRRMLTVFLLGFSSGLPLALTGTTLQAWLKHAGIDLPTIGRFALIGLPYTLKFFWAPFLDDFSPPFLGRRRGWAIVCQAGLLFSIVAMAFTNPAQDLFPFLVASLLITIFSASQDIVLDAFRIEILKNEEFGAGAGVYVTGYRVAMLVSGALAMILADHLSWRTVYLLMAAVMATGIATVWFSPEPTVGLKPSTSFRDRVLQPFSEFFERVGAMEILSFVMIYKLSTMMATSLTTAFLMGIGFSMTEIGTVTKVFGMIASIVGTLTGGALMFKLGMKRSLWTFGILQALAGLSFLLLTRMGHDTPMMVFAICIENFMLGLGLAAIQGFMMSICNQQFSGTQFALLSSLTAIPRVVFVSQAGVLAKALGWPGFFVLSVLFAIPGLLLLTRFDRWSSTRPQGAGKKGISRWDLTTIGLFGVGLLAIASEPVWIFADLAAWGALIVRMGAGTVGLALLAGFFKPGRFDTAGLS